MGVLDLVIVSDVPRPRNTAYSNLKMGLYCAGTLQLKKSRAVVRQLYSKARDHSSDEVGQ